VAGLRVLVTNCWLQTCGGTELYVRDLVLGLQRRGHEPVVWSPLLGEAAEQIKALGVCVTDDLRKVVEPDVLQCHHHDEALAALSRFPDRAGLFVQHAAAAWQDATLTHPRLLRYVAVDDLCRQRIEAAGIEGSRVAVIANGVDLDRFQPRTALPAVPRRALVLSNYASGDNVVPVIRSACARMGIDLDVVGAANGTSIPNPEVRLPEYDLVFAKARAALEALCVGCAVVVADVRGFAGLVTSDVVEEWRRWNFGRHLLTRPYDVDALCAEVDRYDPGDAARCRDRARLCFGLDTMVDELVEEYGRVLEGWSGVVDHRSELIAASRQLSRVGPLRAAAERTRPYVEEHPRLAAAWREAVEHARLLEAERDEQRRTIEVLAAQLHAERPA